MAKKKTYSKRLPETSLTLPDRFYIENNGNLSVEQIARDLGKPLEIIKAYCEDWVKKNPPKKEKTRVNKLMDRPSKRGGVISMTEAASMVGDDSIKKYVTLEAINRAMAEGNEVLAKELKIRYNEQQKENKNLIKSKYKDMIHYIEEPDDDEGV